MPEETKPATTGDGKLELVDFYTFWESLLWHFKSRRSRLILGALLAIVLVQTKPFGISEAQANNIAQYIMYLIGVLVACLTGEKYIPNGNGIPISEPAEVSDEAIKKIENALVKKFEEALSKAENEVPPQ